MIQGKKREWYLIDKINITISVSLSFIESYGNGEEVCIQGEKNYILKQ